MENYNWISAEVMNDLGEWVTVKVRQSEAFRDEFISENGVIYDISRLDFTQAPELPDFMKSFEESNKRYAEQQEEYQKELGKILSSMDANAVADHKAKIDEREYWRKLRGEIFLKAMERYDFNHSGAVDSALSRTKYIVNQLYDQDKYFFIDK